MSDQDKLLRALGAAARRQSTTPSSEAEPPLDAAARERIVERIVENLERAAPPKQAKPAKVVRLAGWRSRVGFASVVLAFAAAVALVMRGRGGDPLPAYVLVGSGVSTERGPESAPPTGCVVRASASGSFEVVARPDTSVTGALTVRAYLVRERRLVVAGFAPQVSPQGAVRILDERSRLVGASELVIVLGRPDALPSDDLLASRARPASGPGWRAIGCTVAPSD